MTSLSLSQYLKSIDAAARQRLAAACETSVEYLFQVSRGTRQPKLRLAVAIDRHTGGAVRYDTLLPDVDWQYLHQVTQRRRLDVDTYT